MLKACQSNSPSAEAPTPPSLGKPIPSSPCPVVPTPSPLEEPSQFLQFISISPAQGQKSAGLIVCLHGNSGTPELMASFVPALNLPQYQFLFPSAPFSHPSVPGGKMWYDLGIQNSKPIIQNYQRLAESQQRLTNWLKSLEGSTGIPLSRTILSGFSQGGAMTLDVGLTLPLAGLVSVSGYLHSQPKPTINKPSPPVLIVHGRQDPLVALSEAHRARDTLSALGVAVNYQEFDMGHEIKPEVLALMRSFVLNAIPK